MELHVILEWERRCPYTIGLTTARRVAAGISVGVSGFRRVLLNTSNWMAGGFVKAQALEHNQFRLSDRLQD